MRAETPSTRSNPEPAPSPAGFEAVSITPSAMRAIRHHGRKSYPEEACGILVGPEAGTSPTARRVVEAREVPNRRTEERTHRFLIPADELRRAERELEGTGLGVVGFYHSHPDHPARPSDFDQDHAWPWYAYLVLAVERGEPGDVGAFELEPEGRVFQPRRLKEEADDGTPPRDPGERSTLGGS